MKRVIPESFISAVRRTGTVPKRCLWVRERQVPGKPPVTEVCAIGALCVDAGAGDRRDVRRWAESVDGLGLETGYVTGFITGFDGQKSVPSWDELGVEMTGYQDGLACAWAAFEERLHEEYDVSWADDPTPWMEPSDAAEAEQYVYCWM